jgi:hypothetical protein
VRLNVSKAEIEGAFADELALLQPTAGYMRVVTAFSTSGSSDGQTRRTGRPSRGKRVKVIQQKLDRLLPV